MPNIWHADGTPVYTPEDDPDFVPYEQQREWNYYPPYHGYRSDFATPERDFSTPIEPTIEEQLEELI